MSIAEAFKGALADVHQKPTLPAKLRCASTTAYTMSKVRAFEFTSAWPGSEA